MIPEPSEKKSTKKSNKGKKKNADAKPAREKLEPAMVEKEDTYDETFSLDHLINKFEYKYEYKTYVSEKVSPDYRNVVAEVIGYNNLRGIRLTVTTNNSNAVSNAKFVSDFQPALVENLIKCDNWKNKFYITAYKACCEFKLVPEFLLVCSTTVNQYLYQVTLNLHTSSTDTKEVTSYILKLINDEDFMDGMLTGYKLYFYNSSDSRMATVIGDLQNSKLVQLNESEGGCQIM